jgi:hypothetical protein
VTAHQLGFFLSALVAAPAFAQTTVDVPPGTTTTVQSQPQQQAPPPPSTTVEVQQAQPAPPPQQPGTQVVVNPQPQPAPAAPPPPPPSQVTRYDTTDIVETHPHRPAMVTIATDALYGGIAGALIGGGIALIGRDGDNWARDLTIGAGAGLLAGGAIGVVEAVSDANDHTARRAAADVRTDGGSAPSALAFSYGGRF